jgi:4-hydroxy-tetrahydrodipicolinate synthase
MRDHYLDAGIRRFFVSGTTGRDGWWSLPRKTEIVSVYMERKPPDVVVLAGCTALGLEEMIENARQMQALGVDYVVITPPPGLKYHPRELEFITLYFADACGEMGVRVALYDYPFIIGNEFGEDTIVHLANHPNIDVLKDSTGRDREDALIKAIQHAGADFVFLQGHEPLILSSLQSGGGGFVSSLMHIEPKAFLALWQAFKSGDLDKASRLQGFITKTYRVVAECLTTYGSTSGLFHLLSVILAARGLNVNILLSHEGETPDWFRGPAERAMELMAEAASLC